MRKQSVVDDNDDADEEDEGDDDDDEFETPKYTTTNKTSNVVGTRSTSRSRQPASNFNKR